MLSPDQLQGQLQTLASQHGISQWDLGATSSSDVSVQVDRGEPKQLKGSQRSAVTVRVWNSEGRVGITSSTDLSVEGLELALKGAAAASAFGDLQEPPGLSCRSTEALQPVERPIREPQPIQTMLNTLLEAERQLLDRHPSASAPCRTTAFQSAVVNGSISTALAHSAMSG